MRFFMRFPVPPHQGALYIEDFKRLCHEVVRSLQSKLR